MIYGIGAKALGDTLGVEENDAAAFIQTFKSKYPGKAVRIHYLVLRPIFSKTVANWWCFVIFISLRKKKNVGFCFSFYKLQFSLYQYEEKAMF